MWPYRRKRMMISRRCMSSTTSSRLCHDCRPIIIVCISHPRRQPWRNQWCVQIKSSTRYTIDAMLSHLWLRLQQHQQRQVVTMARRRMCRGLNSISSARAHHGRNIWSVHDCGVPYLVGMPLVSCNGWITVMRVTSVTNYAWITPR